MSANIPFGFISQAPLEPQRDEEKYPTEEAFFSSDEYRNYQKDKMKFQGFNVYQELVKTERDYVSDLELINKVKDELLVAYQKLNATQKGKYASTEDLTALLDLWSKITLAHAEIATTFETGTHQAWIAQLTALKPLYQQYLVLQSKVNNLPADARNNENTDFFKILARPEFKGLSLASYIIKPVQRLTRYSLLMKELSKGLPTDHEDYAAIQNVRQACEEMAASINEVKRQSEESERLKDSNIRITLDIKSNKTTLKTQLEACVNDWAKKGEAWSLVEMTDKQANKEGVEFGRKVKNFAQGRKEFVIKDQTGIPTFQINLYDDYISVKQMRGKKVSDKDLPGQIAKIHDLVKNINVTVNTAVSPPRLYALNPEALSRIQTLGLNEPNNPIFYKISLPAKQAMQEKREIIKKEIERIEKTTVAVYELSSAYEIPISFQPKVISIAARQLEKHVGIDEKQYDNQLIKQKFEAAIKNGFIPRLENMTAPSDSTIKLKKQGEFSGEIIINTKDPILAIKQYENLLAVGFTPEFSPATKETVKKYVQTVTKNNFELLKGNPRTERERQVEIYAPHNTNAQLRGDLILQRTLKAANDGLLITMDNNVKEALRNYILNNHSTNNKILDPRFKLTKPMSLVGAINVLELASLGILPEKDFNADDARTLKGFLHDVQALPTECEINSGHIARDWVTLQNCCQLGIVAKVKNNQALLTYANELPLDAITVGLESLPAEQQIEQAIYLASVGIEGKISPDIKPQQPITLSSHSEFHAKKMFAGLLNQGFIPGFDSDTAALVQKALSKNTQKIKINTTQPKVLLSQVQQCMQNGFVPELNKKQEVILRNYIADQKEKIKVSIQGYHGEAVRTNVSIAQKLGLFVDILPQAKKSYWQEHAKEGRYTTLQLDVKPVYASRKRFFFFNQKVEDKEKTLDLARNILNQGVNISLTEDMLLMQEKAKKKQSQKWFIFFGPLTKEAKASRKFLNEFAEVEQKMMQVKQDFLDKKYQVISLETDEPAPEKAKVFEEAFGRKSITPMASHLPASGNVKTNLNQEEEKSKERKNLKK